jgi:hypothetical protein
MIARSGCLPCTQPMADTRFLTLSSSCGHSPNHSTISNEQTQTSNSCGLVGGNNSPSSSLRQTPCPPSHHVVSSNCEHDHECDEGHDGNNCINSHRLWPCRGGASPSPNNVRCQESNLAPPDVLLFYSTLRIQKVVERTGTASLVIDYGRKQNDLLWQ